MKDSKLAAGRKPSGVVAPDGLRRSAVSVSDFSVCPKHPRHEMNVRLFLEPLVNEQELIARQQYASIRLPGGTLNRLTGVFGFPAVNR